MLDDAICALIDNFRINFCFRENKRQLAALLSFFQFNVEFGDVNSTWECGCSLYHLKEFISTKEAALTIKGAVYPNNLLLSKSNFQSWHCRVNAILQPRANTQQLLDTSFLEMPADKFLCQNENYECPQKCQCYNRAANYDIIVDCTHQNLTALPRNVPVPSAGGELIVSVAYNRIENFTSCEEPDYIWLRDVRSLNLEHNELSPKNTIDTESFLNCLTNVSRLYLAYNNIEYLPYSIQRKHYGELSISGNKLTCDCKTKWMKHWLQSKSDMIFLSQTVHCREKSE